MLEDRFKNDVTLNVATQALSWTARNPQPITPVPTVLRDFFEA